MVMMRPNLFTSPHIVAVVNTKHTMKVVTLLKKNNQPKNNQAKRTNSAATIQVKIQTTQKALKANVQMKCSIDYICSIDSI